MDLLARLKNMLSLSESSLGSVVHSDLDMLQIIEFAVKSFDRLFSLSYFFTKLFILFN